MYKIILSVRAINRINQYSLKYREYFEELYSDSGIWSEAQIIAHYEQESFHRADEIIDLIDSRLSEECVLGRFSDDTLAIWWRSKLLLVSWQEVWNERIITDISIR